jgi:FecR protein
MTLRILFAALLATVAMACDDPPAPGAPVVAPATGPMGKLTLVEGSVKLSRAGSARPAALEPVFEADLLTTGENGRAVLALNDGRELELAPGSSFRLGESKKLDLDFDEGVITIVQDKSGAAVLTPYGRTRVEPGTRARVESKKKSMAIEILTGGIVTIGADGGAVGAGAGQRLELDLGAVRIVEAPPRKARKLELVQLEVRMVMDKGAVELKRKGEKGFKKSTDGAALEPGTEFRVAGSSRARLAAPGSELVLLPGANGSFVGAAQEDDTSELKVSLKSGQALVRFSGEQKALVVVEGSAFPARLKASSEASVLVAQSPKGPRVQVLTGKVEVVSSSGEALPVSAGESVAVSSAMKVGPAERADLVLPMERRVRVFTNRPLDVGLALGAESVRVQVAADAEFKELLSSGEAAGVLVTRPVGGELHWRTVDEKGQPRKVGGARFLPERSAGRGDKERKEVISDTDYRVVFQEQVPALTFEFPAQPGAKSYRLKVFKDGQLATPVHVEEVKTPRATVASGVLKEGSYRWFGGWVDERGTEKGAGKMNKMDIVYDNSNATLAVHSPAPGAAGQGNGTAEGVAPLGARLFINDKAVPLDAKGRFSVDVGKARPLVFRCVQANGSEDYLLR